MDENSQVNSGRIDLSRFSGITEGKWEIIDTPGGGIDVGVKHGRHEPCAHQPVITFTQRLANIVRKSERDMADLRAIAAVPELISELKKMYAREDELLDALRIIRDDLDDALENEGYESLAHEKSNRTLQKIRNFANDAGLS